MQKLKDFLSKNKVLIIGLLVAIALPVAQELVNGTVSTVALVTSALIALQSWFTRNMRGAWLTISGIVVNAAITLLTDGVPVELKPFILKVLGQVLLAIITSAMPAAKSIEYETGKK